MCGCVPAFVKRIRSRSPSVARIVGPGHLAVVGPGREEDAGRDLDLLVVGDDRVLAQRPTVGKPGDDAAVEARGEGRRVEAVGDVIDVGPVLEARVQGRPGGTVAGVGLGRGAAVAHPHATCRGLAPEGAVDALMVTTSCNSGSDAVASAPPASSRLRLTRRSPGDSFDLPTRENLHLNPVARAALGRPPAHPENRSR